MSGPSSRRNRLLAGAGILLLLLLVAVGVCYHRMENQQAAATPLRAPTPKAAPTRVVIGDVQGQVERQGADAIWVAAANGDELSTESEIRTGDQGSAVLKIGDRTTVKVEPKTRLSVAEIQEKVSRVNLTDGRISAVVGQDATLRVVSGKDGPEAESTGPGEFKAMADGHGRLTVSSEQGTVRLASAGHVVDLLAGQQSSATGEEAPSEPTAIPGSLYLKILPPPAHDNRKADVVVTARTTPGALVKVNGKPVGIANSDHMDLHIHLEEGVNHIVVEVEDLAGRTMTQEIALTLQSQPVKVHTQVTW